MVSPSRYSIFRNAVRTSRGAYTSVNPRGEGLAKASMVHLSQDDKPEKVAWSVQPQLRHAIDHVFMLAQGVKKIDKVAKTPLCEHTSRESSFKFLKPNEVFDRKENFRLKVDPDSDFPIKPPHLDGSLGSFSMPASFNVPAACVSASEELSHRAAVYGSVADVMFSSIIHSLAPEDERAPLLREDHHSSRSLHEVHNSLCGCCVQLAVGTPGCCFGPSGAEPVDGFPSQDSTIFRDTSDGSRSQSVLRGDRETQRATGASWWSFSQLQESSSTWYCSVQVCVESWPKLQQTSRCWCQGEAALS